jgi:hypothetical protein
MNGLTVGAVAPTREVDALCRESVSRSDGPDQEVEQRTMGDVRIAV